MVKALSVDKNKSMLSTCCYTDSDRNKINTPCFSLWFCYRKQLLWTSVFHSYPKWREASCVVPVLHT